MLSDLERLGGDEHKIQKFIIGLRARQARRGGDQAFDISSQTTRRSVTWNLNTHTQKNQTAGLSVI